MTEPASGGSPTQQGSCLCGKVRYRLNAPIKAVSHCHCGQCRKFHGAAFASYGSVRVEDYEITAGHDVLRRFESSPGVLRTFCGTCGSSLTWHNSGGRFPDWISLALGTLDTAFVPWQERHVHVDSKAAWDHWPAPAHGA